MKRNRGSEGRIGEWLMLLGVIVLSGCAGASVSSETANATPANNARPSAIYVYTFAASAKDVTLNQSIFQRAYRQISNNEDQSQLKMAEDTAQALSAAIVQQLQGLGFTATQIARGTKVSGDNVLVVDGEFADINEGNRLRRLVIGLGAGQATLDTNVHVYQMAGASTQQIMDFSTHADSGKMPGAVLTAPAGAAAGGAAAAASLGANVAMGASKTYNSTIGSLAKKSANKSVAHMSQYFATQGWIPQSMATDENAS